MLLSAMLVILAVAWCFRNNCILYYGDAQAHLDTSRSIIDSRTPGWESIGTVWLPLLHVLCLPLVWKKSLWASGLAGSIPVALFAAMAFVCFYLAAWKVYGDRLAAVVVLGCIALNPNILYLSAIPMTEMVFAGALGLFLCALLQFRNAGTTVSLVCAAVASSLMSLTRYDGWFLIPFEIALVVWSARPGHRVRLGLPFALVALLAPAYWCWHNWWETGNVLDFFNGPYSAKAIQGARPYPGYDNWLLSLRYYLEAGRLCAGAPLLLLGLAGFGCALWKRQWMVPAFLLLPPVFYVWSIHSAGLPIHVPTFTPFSYYNTRYAIALVLLAGFSAGALVLLIPMRLRPLSYLLPVVAFLPWAVKASPENWICWKESQVNSVARRHYRDDAASTLAAQYKLGEGVLLQCCGDLTDILSSVGIPLKDAIHEGNGPWWEAATARPDIFHPALWAIAKDGDPVARALARPKSPYSISLKLHVFREAALNVYRLQTPASATPSKRP